MGDKKHIDRLFQERFKDFEVQPDDAVWDNIQAKLHQKKKKRRVIPIWWRYAGVAAVLAILLTVGISLFTTNDTENVTPKIVDTEKTDSVESSNTTLQNNNEISITDNNVTEISKTEEQQDHNSSTSNATNKAVENTLNLNEQTPSVVSTSNSKENSKTETTSNASKGNKNSKSEISNSIKTAVADNGALINKPEAEDNAAEENHANKVINNTNANENTTVIANNKNINNNTDAALNTNNSENTKVAENTSENEKKNIEEAITENKLLLEDEKTEIADTKKWSVAPNAAPVYFSSLGKGSSIDAQFNENSKSGEVNMSYGLNASYAINNRLTVRSGINRVNLGYNTNDVVVFSSVNASTNSKTINALSSSADNSAPNIAVSAGENIAIMSATAFDSNNIAAFETTNTSINQSFGFIEVPLELQYAISTKRLGINVIGGFSSLFLNNYESFSIVEGERTRLQERDNINNTSYSANFGLGLNYKVSKKINLNLEPMFKYQINTFKNTSGDFQPFFIGVYTGFGIKF